VCQLVSLSLFFFFFLVKSSCTDCPAGQYSSTIRASTCAACDAGQYQSLPAQSACLDCDSGSYAASSGTSTCIDCPAGHYSGGGASACVACAAGYVASGAASSFCSPCSAGYYSGSGASVCTACAAGYYSSASPSTTCGTCPTGEEHNTLHTHALARKCSIEHKFRHKPISCLTLFYVFLTDRDYSIGCALHFCNRTFSCCCRLLFPPSGPTQASTAPLRPLRALPVPLAATAPFRRPRFAASAPPGSTARATRPVASHVPSANTRASRGQTLAPTAQRALSPAPLRGPTAPIALAADTTIGAACLCASTAIKGSTRT